MKKRFTFFAIGALAILGAGLLMTGCSFTPDLNKTAALTMIQAEYDKRPAEGVTIRIDDTGLKQGLAAKYWKLTKVYPNNRWADYSLTDDGKKVLKLTTGGDVIEWRPEIGNNDYHFYVVTVAASHPKAKDLQDPQDGVVPGVDTAKTADFTESVNLAGVPQPLQDIAHNTGNKLSYKRHADFALVRGNWQLYRIS